MRSEADRPLVEGLGDRLRAGLGRLVEPGEPVALLDFPNHGNAGDSLIWLGTLAWLRAGGHELSYAADHTGFSARELRRRRPRGTILLHGGGNFGDLWPVYQRFREHVIASFPHHRIVQLPQTVHFARRDAATAADVIGRHPDLTICVRDRVSERLVRDEMRARCVLLPDMAFALGPMDPGEPCHEVLCLLREDAERAAGRPVTAGVRTDWPEPAAAWRSLRQATRVAGKLGSLVPPLARMAAPSLAAGYERLANERLDAGLRVVGSGSLVVTDRLHGHILALLAGVPQVLLDNSYGKLRAFWEAWTREAQTVQVAEP